MLVILKQINKALKEIHYLLYQLGIILTLSERTTCQRCMS
nr:MAG TPA: hypothetical protein [Caudoviricetes sp.]